MKIAFGPLLETEPLEGVRTEAELPRNARAYLDRLAEVSGCAVGIASNGAEREAIVLMPDSPLDALLP